LGRHCRPPRFGGASFDNTFVDGAFVDGAFVDVALASRVVDQSRARATSQVRYTLATQLVLSAPYGVANRLAKTQRDACYPDKGSLTLSYNHI
jgi:hypothetical protein